MLVLISWSGDKSLAIAEQIKAWLPDVVRNAEPWLSRDDLRKGPQWLPELNKNLSAAGFGLSVITADNKDAPWLLFEAGVISKALPDKYCCPILCDLKQADISGPFANFQSTTITSREDMLLLVKTMNDASGPSKVDDDRLTKWFSNSWEDFEKQVCQALAAKSASLLPTKAQRTDRELLEEVLSAVRRFAIGPRTLMERVLLRRSRGALPQSHEELMQELLSLPFPVDDFSVRTRMTLTRAGVKTVRDVVQLNEADLMKIGGFGNTSLYEVKEWLAREGLSLDRSGSDAQ